jgi:transcriptional regulator with XRE-family HTH domain
MPRATVDLRAERLNRGLSLRQAAREMGVPEQSIRRVEADLGVTPQNAFKIASFYGYKVTELWPVGPEPPGGPVQAGVAIGGSGITTPEERAA